jgi:hypothetical protein
MSSQLTRRWREPDSTFGPPSRKGQHFSRPPRNSATTNRPGGQNRILTIAKGRFTVRRARLAPAMISTPGHRASRRRQCGGLPAWSLFGSSQPVPGDGVLQVVDRRAPRSLARGDRGAKWGLPRRRRAESSCGDRGCEVRMLRTHTLLKIGCLNRSPKSSDIGIGATAVATTANTAGTELLSSDAS